MPLGTDDDRGGAAAPQRPETARAVLEAELLAALMRPPCVVSFSGGRDSSAMLAVATAVARREGLPDPVPVTNRFPRAPATDESAWQRLVIDHLELRSWQQLAFDDELDLVGDVAASGLLRHGLLWPANAHFHVPLLEQARGGSLVTGIDGDALLGGWPWGRGQGVLHGRVRPEPRDALRVGLVLAPERLRRRLRPPASASVYFPWLRPDAAREALRQFSAPPRSWRGWVNLYRRRRYLQHAVDSLALLGAARDVELHHPFSADRFLAALAAEGGTAGFAGRSRAMGYLFADLLPEAVLTRESKASFDAILWGPRARAFIDGWSGAGVDENLVDVDRLRTIWADDEPHFGTGPLLQSLWLEARQRSSPRIARPA